MERALILNASMANIKQPFGPEKLSGHSRNRPLDHCAMLQLVIMNSKIQLCLKAFFSAIKAVWSWWSYIIKNSNKILIQGKLKQGLWPRLFVTLQKMWWKNRNASTFTRSCFVNLWKSRHAIGGYRHFLQNVEFFSPFNILWIKENCAIPFIKLRD